jgi:CheY-like chemotaxis protein
MKKKILWIEDESFMVKGLLRPMEKLGFQIDVADSALAGYHKAAAWDDYDLLIVDLIIPLSSDEHTTPEIVKSWDNDRFAGIGLSKWLTTELNVQIPILLLSVVRNPLTEYDLEKYGLKYYLPKSGLLPSRVKEEILKILGGSA